MPPKRQRQRLFQEDDVSSPDPLGFSGREIERPITPKRRAPGRTRELSFDAEILRGKSPSKTVIIDPESDNGKSPYRIRVTVEAEPRDTAYTGRKSPAKRKSPEKPRESTKRARTRSQSPVKVKTINVPLRDEDEDRRTRSGTPAPKRRKATPRKSMTLAEINEWYDGGFKPGRNFPKTSKMDNTELSQKQADDGEVEQVDSMVVEPSMLPASPKKHTPRTSPRKSGRPARSPAQISKVVEDVVLHSTESEAGQFLSLTAITNTRHLRAENHKSRDSSAANASQRMTDTSSRFPDAPSASELLGNVPALQPQQSARKAHRIAFSPLPNRRTNDSYLLYPALPVPVLKDNHEEAPATDLAEPAEQDAYPNVIDQNESESDHALQDDLDDEIMMSGARPIGDDTMMKSMDMTIVSPSALYSRLDVQSSILHGTPTTAMIKPSIGRRPSGAISVDQENNEAASHSSPHVQWSSPLIQHDQKHTPNTQAQPTRSASSSRHKQLLEQSPTRLPRHQLLTPDSDELDKENKVPEHSTLRTDANTVEEEPKAMLELASQLAPEARIEASVNAERVVTNAFPNQSLPQTKYSTTQLASTNIVDISDATDSEDESAVSESPAPEQNYEHQNDMPEDYTEPESDLEVNEDHDIDVPEETLDLWQQAGEHTGSFVDESQRSERPTAASFRAGQRWKRPTIHSTRDSRSNESSGAGTKSQNLEHQSEQAADVDNTSGNTTIAQLFETAFRKNRAQVHQEDLTEELSDAEEPTEQDLSALVRRRIADTMANVDFSLAAVQRTSVATEPTVTERPEADTLSSAYQSVAPRLSPTPNPVLPHSPRRSSPLKHHFIDDASEDEVEADEEPTNLDYISMLSDARQLQNDQRAVKQSAPFQRRPQRRTLLKLTQERQARARMDSPVNKSVFESTIIGSSAIGSSELHNVEESEQAQDGFHVRRTFKVPDPTAHARSLLPAFGDDSRIEQFESTIDGSVPQTHRLLDSFRLLPRMHPWTDSHFQALLSLYKHWKGHESHYSQQDPANVGIMSTRWQKYVDMEFYNWGYDLKLSESLVMIAALFSQLLQLEDSEAYKVRYGEDMLLGIVAERTVSHGPITDWHIILRLCTVILGDVIRADEAKGVVIDRRPALKWRMKGQIFWRRGWLAGIF